MNEKIATAIVAALALITAYGPANAAAPGLLHTTAAVIAPAAGLDIADQRDIIAPPSDIDPGMAKSPPAIGMPMPIIVPPEALGGRFGIER
jgi:hypothetical protein